MVGDIFFRPSREGTHLEFFGGVGHLLHHITTADAANVLPADVPLFCNLIILKVDGDRFFFAGWQLASISWRTLSSNSSGDMNLCCASSGSGFTGGE